MSGAVGDGNMSTAADSWTFTNVSATSSDFGCPTAITFSATYSLDHRFGRDAGLHRHERDLNRCAGAPGSVACVRRLDFAPRGVFD